MENIYRDIYRLKNCKVFRKIEEGWSSDAKYYVEDDKGQKLVLRTADISVYEDKLLEYQMIQLFNQLDFTMSLAIDFGTCKGGKLVYMLLSYVEGQSLDLCIANLPQARQYELGLQAGKILKQIHSLSCDATHDKQYKIQKMLDKIKRYEVCHYPIPHDGVAITYIHDNIHKLASLPTVFNHGDFHV
ncbi:MAG: aminoglycoside phosphotransferase family protein, partial [Turicibacter sp.]